MTDEANLSNIETEAGKGALAAEAPEPKKRKKRTKFFVTDQNGNEIKLKLLGYSEVRGTVYAICTSGDADTGKAAVFRLFYAGKKLCFELIKDKKLCEEIMDEYIGKLLK